MTAASRTVRVMVSVMLAGLLAATVETDGVQQPSGELPGRLREYVTQQVKLPASDYTRLLQGEPVTGLLPADPSKEVAVFGAVWINAPMSAYLAAVKDIERFEKGPSFLVTKKISSPPRLEDFAQLSLSAEDIEDLKTCEVGDCELKLGEDALRRFQKEIDWKKPLPQATVDAERLFRSMALDYVTRYRTAGNSALAAYRDTSRPTFVAEEFKTMIDQMPLLTDYLPEIKNYLLAYPKASLPRADSFLYWQSAKFGLKPTIRINHVVTSVQPSGAIVASKMLYANHYFWTAIELRVLVPDPARGKGFWFATVSQSRSDGLSGFIGPLIRGRVRDEAEKGTEAALRAAKASLEKP
jgi:hypothetical protein